VVREAAAESPAVSVRENEHTRWNFPVMATESTVFMTGMAWADPGTVLPLFIGHLSGSTVLLGLAPVLQRLGYILPLLPVAALVGHRPNRRPYLRWGVLVGRAPFFGFLAYLWLVGIGNASATLTFMFIAYLFVALGNGFVGVPWQDIIAKSIPAGIRGRFFGTMQFLTAACVFGVGFGVRWMLGPHGPGFPRSYLFLFSLAGLFFTLSTVGCWIIREPIRPVLDQRETLRELIADIGPFLRRQRALRPLAAVALLGMGMCLMTPFYMAYATRELGVPPQFAGVYLGAFTIGSAVSSLVWAHLNDKHGPRSPIRCATAMIVLVPVLALTAPVAARVTGGLLPGTAVLPYLFGVVFLVAGTNRTGLWLGTNNYIFDLSSHEERHRYIAVANTLAAPGALLPLLIGKLLEFLPYPVVFLLLAGLGATVVGLALRLPKPDEG
jgi:MFS family permease